MRRSMHAGGTPAPPEEGGQGGGGRRQCCAQRQDVEARGVATGVALMGGADQSQVLGLTETVTVIVPRERNHHLTRRTRT